MANAMFDLDIDTPEPWHAPRCIVLASQDVINLDFSTLWIDSLHIPLHGPFLGFSGIGIIGYGRAYMTNTVMQQDQTSEGLMSYVTAYRSTGGFHAEGVEIFQEKNL